MRLVVLVFAVAAAACSINHRSEQYACDTNDDCGAGRTCSNGFCVVTGDPTADAPRGDGPRSDGGGDGSGSCPAPCTSCNTSAKTCTIDCTKTSCTSKVVCPAGYECEIACNAENACKNGISCTEATGCNIDCIARQSCQKVECGPGPCNVSCSGPSSCKDVSCGNSCACDIACTGNQSCLQGIQCTSFACRSGLGCSSMSQFCNSCQ